ncbi:MAG: hypothetical protein HKN16_00805 [Saprospiraceae bacterium]|nr:hypothetical protein [Saprospiraceae bacterium]
MRCSMVSKNRFCFCPFYSLDSFCTGDHSP